MNLINDFIVALRKISVIKHKKKILLLFFRIFC